MVVMLCVRLELDRAEDELGRTEYVYMMTVVP